MEAEDHRIRPVREAVAAQSQQRLVLAVPHDSEVQHLAVYEALLHREGKSLLIVGALAEGERIADGYDPGPALPFHGVLSVAPHMSRVGADPDTLILEEVELCSGDVA